jgi:ubiquitin carboxyl-terminal hydrolase 4/11/15
MADQDQSSVLNIHASTSNPPPSILSPAEKYAIITTLKKKEMVDGETWFVVSHAWYRTWEAACSGQATKEVPVDESSIAAVNNDDIADVAGNLGLNHTEGIDVDYVPEQAWEHFEQWYAVVLSSYSKNGS